MFWQNNDFVVDGLEIYSKLGRMYSSRYRSLIVFKTPKDVVEYVSSNLEYASSRRSLYLFPPSGVRRWLVPRYVTL